MKGSILERMSIPLQPYPLEKVLLSVLMLLESCMKATPLFRHPDPSSRMDQAK